MRSTALPRLPIFSELGCRLAGAHPLEEKHLDVRTRRSDGSRRGGQPSQGLAAVASKSELPKPEAICPPVGARPLRGKNTAMFAPVDRTDFVKRTTQPGFGSRGKPIRAPKPEALLC
jgi:hypothetical protein